MINVLNDDGTLTAAAGEDFIGLDRFAGRKAAAIGGGVKELSSPIAAAPVRVSDAAAEPPLLPPVPPPAPRPPVAVL